MGKEEPGSSLRQWKDLSSGVNVSKKCLGRVVNCRLCLDAPTSLNSSKRKNVNYREGWAEMCFTSDDTNIVIIGHLKG